MMINSGQAILSISSRNSWTSAAHSSAQLVLLPHGIRHALRSGLPTCFDSAELQVWHEASIVEQGSADAGAGWLFQEFERRGLPSLIPVALSMGLAATLFVGSLWA